MCGTRISNCRTTSSSPSSRSTELSVRTARCSRILEERGVAYTGEGVEGSELAFDKIRSKEKFREHEVTTPNWQVIDGRPAADDSNSVRHQGAAAGIDRRRSHHEERARDRRRACRMRAKYDQRIAGREIYSRARADHRHSRRPGAADSRNHSEGRLLRFHEQVSVPESERGRRRGTCLSGANLRKNRRSAIQDLALARASLAWPEGLFARRHHAAGRRRADRARSQHHPGNDRSESAAGSGGGRRNQLSGTVRAHHRTFARGAEPAK